ncbi:MAG: NAD(P)-dependent oxidoreductase [Eubacteriales bacterium]
MNIAILDSATLGDDIDLSPLSKIGNLSEYPLTEDEKVSQRLENADVAVINKIKLGRNNLSGAKNLRLICVAATGYDNIDTEYCREKGIALCNVPGYSTDSVAELTAAMALSLLTHLTEYRDFVHSGKYSESGKANCLVPVYHEMSSLTWGIVGGGGIGARVAGIASALGCKVIMCRRKKEERYDQVSIDELCERADIISLHVPLNEETRNMINDNRIEKMKDGVIFINVSRGAVADEKALAEAVESGKIGGLGIDVYSKEPFGKEHPFYSLLGRKNVCLTPHMAWGAYEARNRCIKTIAENINSFFSGEVENRIV